MNNVSNLVKAICQVCYMSLVKEDMTLSAWVGEPGSDEWLRADERAEVVSDYLDDYEDAGFSPGPDYDNRAW